MNSASQHPTPTDTAGAPSVPGRITVVMANHRGAAWLGQAIDSVLMQSHADLELIVSDDASGDGSAGIVRAAAARDPRVRLIEADSNAGPSVARNRGLDAATGDWIAVVDSDDLIHPQRFERLLDAAARHAADMVADDMVLFGDTPGVGGRTLLGPMRMADALVVDTTRYVRSNGGKPDTPSLGYLKPLIRRSLIGDLRYDPKVRIGEDYDFYLKLLIRGGRFVVLPEPLYLYRRHSSSLSHRLSVATLEPLLAAHVTLAGTLAASDGQLVEAMDERRRDLEAALRYERLVAALKARDAAGAGRLLARHPALLAPLVRSLSERLRRRKTAQASGTPTPLTLDLSTRAGSAAGRHIALPPIAAAGSADSARWLAVAAELSELSARHRLDLQAVGAEGLFALGMVPVWRSACLSLDPSEAERLRHLIPEGTTLQLTGRSAA